MSDDRPKEIVTTWDVFDTLVTRFVPDPNYVFEVLEQKHNVPAFLDRRLKAQASLDTIGAPYVLHDIYLQLVVDGISLDLSRFLLSRELAVERDMMVPIRANIIRVGPCDIMVSDMYWSSEQISSLLHEVCKFAVLRPVVVSNWGKSTGAIWPLLQNKFIIRRHVGNDAHADCEMPSRFNIKSEQVVNHQLSEWEMTLHQQGFDWLALIQREVRLRQITEPTSLFHQTVVGPFLSLLLAFSMHLIQRLGIGTEFAFLSRSSDELARVFAALFPNVRATNLDITRRLARQPNLDGVFMQGLSPTTVVVDILSSGRSFFQFADRNSGACRCFVVLAFLASALHGDERKKMLHYMSTARLQTVFHCEYSDARHWNLEVLLQSTTEIVTNASFDAGCGGLVRCFGPAELEPEEFRLVAWKAEVVTSFIETLARRGVTKQKESAVFDLMTMSLQKILDADGLSAQFGSFVAREISADWT